MLTQRAYSNLNLNDTRDLLKLLEDNKTVLTIFSNSNLPFSYAIRCKTNSKWSHCAFILPDGNIIESSATRGAVVIDILDNFKHRAKEWAIADYYCENPQLAYAYFLSQKGKNTILQAWWDMLLRTVISKKMMHGSVVKLVRHHLLKAVRLISNVNAVT